ncbi:MAG: hypothetical protein QM754_15515 [Tepidisphaeraceae bacterium]
MSKPHVAQLRLDNHRFKDQKGKWIVHFKSRTSLATDWQKQRLVSLGCRPEQLVGLRFPIANQLIAKLKRAQQTAGRNGATPQVDEGTPVQEQKTRD